MTRKEICDFWIGNFESSSDYFDFLGENPEFFQDESVVQDFWTFSSSIGNWKLGQHGSILNIGALK